MSKRFAAKGGATRLPYKATVASAAALLLLLIVLASVLLPMANAYRLDMAISLAPISLRHPLGTDELGRDMLSRFVVGAGVTIVRGLLAALVAAVAGQLLGSAARRLPPAYRFCLTIASYALYVAPGYLMGRRWPSRALMSLLCAFGGLPFLWLALAAIAWSGLVGAPGAAIVGLAFAPALAFRITSSGRLPAKTGLSEAGNGWFAALAALPPVWFWAMVSLTALDRIGLGAQPPQPSWGTIIAMENPLATFAVGIGFVTAAVAAFLGSDVLTAALGAPAHSVEPDHDQQYQRRRGGTP